jgi:LEA14-like dessication related protein
MIKPDIDECRVLRAFRFRIVGGLFFVIAAILSGCATRPVLSGSPILIEVGKVRTEALDQFRVRFSFDLAVTNRCARPESIVLSRDLALGGFLVSFSFDDKMSLAPGETKRVPCEFTADTRDLSGKIPDLAERSVLAWKIAVRAQAGSEDGASLGIGHAEGVCPLVREPELTIKSIVLVKHELINVLLEIVLDVKNTNGFPVDFSSASYQFYGESRKWANGTVGKPVTIPAGGSAEVRLPIVLNFTEMDRGLFDLVAKLKVVRYRLAGEARVTTPVSFLPEFRMRFDKSGATQVERTLSESH